MTNLTDYRAKQIADEAAKRLEQPELKPCPFCGGEAHIEVYGATGVHNAKCNECGAEGIGAYEEHDAIEAWNTRAERTCHMTYNEAWSGDELYPTTAYTCSRCNYITLEGAPKYCPNCGAKVIDKVVEHDQD